ncbi:MAG: ankyrin repeat domain-containing protein [Tatlockia sp.]|nr:ankyrin repeat domain-containing protein [Tatlockia sp.]
MSKLEALLNTMAYGKIKLEDFKSSAMLLAKQGVDLKEKATTDHFKGTLLHMLIQTNINGVNDNEIIELLTSYKDLVDVQDRYNRTPLEDLMNQWAYNKCTVVDFKKSAKILTEHKADLKVKASTDHFKGTLLHALVRTNINGVNDNEIIELLTRHKDLVDVQDRYNCTPLEDLMNQWAYNKCTVEDFKKSAKILTEHKADLKVRASTGEFKGTLLHALVRTNINGDNYDQITELLNSDKDLVNLEDGFDATPLQELMSQLVYKQCTLSDFIMSAKLLASFTADLYVVDKTEIQGTLIHHLFYRNENGCNNEDIKTLLTGDKNLINATDGFKQTPLQGLLFRNCKTPVEVVENLLELGSNLHAEDLFENNLLRTCSISGNLEVANYLITKGLDITARTKKGRTMLHSSVKHTNKAFWEWLHAKGIDINAEDTRGLRAIHLAALAGNWLMVQWLIQKGANLDSREIDTYKNYLDINTRVFNLITNSKRENIGTVLIKIEKGVSPVEFTFTSKKLDQPVITRLENPASEIFHKNKENDGSLLITTKSMNKPLESSLPSKIIDNTSLKSVEEISPHAHEDHETIIKILIKNNSKLSRLLKYNQPIDPTLVEQVKKVDLKKLTIGSIHDLLLLQNYRAKKIKEMPDMEFSSKEEAALYKKELEIFYIRAIKIRLSDDPPNVKCQRLIDTAHNCFSQRDSGKRFFADFILVLSCFVLVGLVVGLSRVATGHTFLFSQQPTKREEDFLLLLAKQNNDVDENENLESLHLLRARN